MAIVRTDSREIGFILTPSEQISNAVIAAKALKEVIAQKPEPVIINGEQYLEFDDLQLCGQFYGYTVRTGEAEMVEVDNVKGAKAHADLIEIRTGLIIGGAEAYCMRDEEKWGMRPKYEWQGEGNDRKRVKIGEELVPWFQLASMAQTRAGAKAFRNRLAWVVVLAGFKATPAEEITEGTVSGAVEERRTVDKSSHYCPVHNVNFFKKGRMKGYAHPIEGTKEWCNEPEVKPEEPPEPSSLVEEALPSVPESVRKAVAEEGSDNLPTPGSPPTTERKEFENIGDLLSRCAKIKTAAYPKGVSRQAVLDILGIKSIDDLRGLNLNDAWQKLQEYIKGKKE